MVMPTKKSKEYVEYEKFAQDIFQTLLDDEEIKPIKVQHNVNIKGRSGCKHQIDVYWEFEIACVTHRVAIECKNYNTSNIPIGRIRDFYGALADIGNITGIFVCKNGYQSGAVSFAKYYGIDLKELRVPKSMDMEGRIQTININLLVCNKNIKQIHPTYDNEWFYLKYQIPIEDQHYEINSNNNEILIMDIDRNRISDLYELESKLPHDFKDELNKEYEYKWADAYIDVKELGLLKIKSLKYIYDVVFTDPKKIIISGKELAKAILIDVRTGGIKLFDKNGNIK